jgi:hypothetical protein
MKYHDNPSSKGAERTATKGEVMALFTQSRGVVFLTLLTALTLSSACGPRGTTQPTESSGRVPTATASPTGSGTAGGTIPDTTASPTGSATPGSTSGGAIATSPGGTAGGTGATEGPAPATPPAPTTSPTPAPSPPPAQPPSGGVPAGAGGTAQGVNVGLLTLGALVAAAGTVAITRRRQAQDRHIR